MKIDASVNALQQLDKMNSDQKSAGRRLLVSTIQTLIKMLKDEKAGDAFISDSLKQKIPENLSEETNALLGQKQQLPHEDVIKLTRQL